ncbi:MAG: hypothetical protein Q7S98_05000, partial [Deltaproteobacteria bacterium]|nr:hypothetical protein [Deltaproteobacteria bacterium]
MAPPPVWYNRGIPKIPLAVGLPAFAASYWAIAQLGLSQDPHNWIDAATNPSDYFRGTKYSPASAFDWFNREAPLDPKSSSSWQDTVAARYLFTGTNYERFGMNYERAAAVTDCMDAAREKGQDPRSCGVYQAMGEDRKNMDQKAGWAALAMGYGGWFFNYRKVPGLDRALSYPASTGMVTVYAGTYALARQISDGMGEIRLERLAQGREGEGYNWTEVMNRPANWTVMQSEMALRPHYSIASAWAMDKATRWNAQFYRWMAARVEQNLASKPSYAYERLAQRGIGAAGKAAFVVKAGVVVAGAAVAVRGAQGALRLYRGEYQGRSEQAREIGWTAAGATATAVGLHQVARSRSMFRNFAVAAGEERTIAAAFTKNVIRFDPNEAYAFAKNEHGWRRAAGRAAVVATGAYGAYEGAQAAWRLATEESTDKVKDGVIFAAGATAATLGAVTLFRGRLASVPVLRDLIPVAEAASIAAASIPTGLALFVQPHRLTAMAGDLLITGVPNGFVNMGTRVAQGYTQPDVLMAEFSRSFVTPLPSSAYDIVMRSVFGRIPSVGEKIYVTNATAYQPITIWNQSRATGPMNEGTLIRLWTSATPEERDQLAPRIEHYDNLIFKTVPERTAANLNKALASFRSKLNTLRRVDPDLTSRHFGIIDYYLGPLEEEARAGRVNKAALGDFVRVVV